MKVHDYIVDESVPVIVYDVSIEDMEQRRKKAKYTRPSNGHLKCYRFLTM